MIASEPVTSVEEAAAQIRALAEHAAQMADELAELRRTTGEENVDLKARLRAAGHRIEDLERRSQRAAASRARGAPTTKPRGAGKKRAASEGRKQKPA